MTDRLIPSSGSEGRQSEEQEDGLLGCTASGTSTDPPSTSMLQGEKTKEEYWEDGYLAGQGAQFVLLRSQRDELLDMVKGFAEWGIIVGPETDTYIAMIRKARALVDTVQGRDPSQRVEGGKMTMCGEAQDAGSSTE